MRANDHNCNIPRYVDTSEEVEAISIEDTRAEILEARAEKQKALDALNAMMKELGLEGV